MAKPPRDDLTNGSIKLFLILPREFSGIRHVYWVEASPSCGYHTRSEIL
jgi:hypothetical protein